MLEILLTIAPIFVLIVLGHVLRRGGIPSMEFWNLNDKLVYWVLVPSLLFYKTSTMEVSFDSLSSYAVTILGGFSASVVLSLVIAKLCGWSAPVASSLMQGAARHNTFIALAVAHSLFGVQGLAMAVLGSAILIPITNIIVVTLMVMLLHGQNEGSVVRAILRDLARNPLLVAVGLGVCLNLLQIGPIPVIHDVTSLLGGAALPVVLLCVGANIRVRAMATSLGPTIASMLCKMLLFPVTIYGLAQWVGLDTNEILVALLFGAVPTAASGYTLARQMGGDAPLMASMITLQTALAFVTLPLTIMLAMQLLQA